MRKNKQWSHELKVEVCKKLLEGQPYSKLQKEYGIKNSGMMANWKKQYLQGTLVKGTKKGRKKEEYNELEMLKKCFAQLMKIRSE